MTERLTIKEILQRTTEHFKKYEIESPRLDAEVLLADILDIERINLYVEFDRPLTEEEINEYRKRVVKRSKRIPVAYIIGYQEFMSLKFKVTEDVLIPRPETEHLVEEAKNQIESWDEREELTIVDLCTGSGAIIISLAKLLQDSQLELNYIATDLSQSALQVAKENARYHGVYEEINFLTGDLLEPIMELEQEIDLILSNPPYIAQDELQNLQPELQHEPELALVGGSEGLKYYRQIITDAWQLLAADGIIALEIGANQRFEVNKLLSDNGYTNLEVVNDYAGKPRVISGQKVDCKL
ncbi:MAG: peptide chain release factor N(5)-glutamine methyltransferase [Bacillota bacterium]